MATSRAKSAKPTILLGADHGGYQLKEEVKAWLEDWGYVYEDLGAHALNPRDDYPPFAFAVAQAVAAKLTAGVPAVGMLCCRSGAGMCIAANKVAGIRAVNASTMSAVKHARNDDNANVLCLQGDWLEPAQARHLVLAFLETPFSEAERHQRRIAQVSQFEETRKQA